MSKQAVPLRSPFASPIRAAVSPSAPATPESKADEQKPAAVSSKPAHRRVRRHLLPRPRSQPSPARSKPCSGGRDPFISPISTARRQAAVCTSGGKRCLMIDRIKLKGVVRSESGFIAVVVNTANRAYFLRENDPLMDGYVVRITSNTVTFKETGKDRTGHSVTRDVTLTMSGPAGRESGG